MEQACEVFEKIEHDRLGFFRNELWIHTNIDAKTLLDQDEVSSVQDCRLLHGHLVQLSLGRHISFNGFVVEAHIHYWVYNY